jgi:hypothetical protein
MRPATFFLVLLALAPSSGVVASRQAATPDDGKREFIVSGCLLASGYAGYQLDEARLVAIDGKRRPEPAGADAPVAPKKWILDGGGNLRPRIGENVEVTGRSDWQPSPAGPLPDEPPDRSPHLDVKSVKTVAPSCT